MSHENFRNGKIHVPSRCFGQNDFQISNLFIDADQVSTAPLALAEEMIRALHGFEFVNFKSTYMYSEIKTFSELTNTLC